jgi:hypothetical protein
MDVNVITLPSETIFTSHLKVAAMWGAPQSVSSGGLYMDADRLLSVVKAKNGNNNSAKQYMLTSGMTSSALESNVPEMLFSTPDAPVKGVSAVKALQLANDQSIPIYTINQTNIATTLPQLHVGQDVIVDIQNAVNAGKVVTVSQTNIIYNGWEGCGYIIINPETGAGAYMISGGLSGAAMMTYVDMAITLSAWGDAWINISGYWVNVYNKNNPIMDNGNLSNGTEQQDLVCSKPAGVFNIWPCSKQCCLTHDLCYQRNSCNASSWLTNAVRGNGACNLCNYEALICIMNNIGGTNCSDIDWSGTLDHI